MSVRSKLAALALMSERDWQVLVVDAARLFGWTAFHVLHARGMEAGWPDLVLIRPPEFVVVELKREDGKVTAAQGRVLTMLEQCGIEQHVWRPSDEAEMLERLRRAR